MQSVLGVFSIGRALVIAVVVTLAVSSVGFQADAPGQPLQPVGDAASVVRLVQGTRSILWTTLAGPIDSYLIQGWPSRDGDVELGGALVLEQVVAEAGVIALGERPMSLTFELAG